MVAPVKILFATVCWAGAIHTAFAAPPVALEKAIDAVTERSYLAPREAILSLERIEATYAPLSPRDQAQVYEQLSKAKFYANDFSGSLQVGKALETLGKRLNDQDIECLGVLQQFYPSWKLGKIQSAYELSVRTQRFAASLISNHTKVKVLATKALMESDEHQVPAALRTVDEALRLAEAAHDDALLFMAIKTQASLALAANDTGLALSAVDRLLALGRSSPYPERLVRAYAVEYQSASAAGLTSRASETMASRIRLMRDLHLDEALGRTLIDYSDLQLKSNRYADAVRISGQALNLESVQTDGALATRAHFNHAIATLRLGSASAAKAEVERLFESSPGRSQLLPYLPQYVAALTQMGEVDESVRVGALQHQVEAEEALHAAKQEEKTQEQITALARENHLKAVETSNERVQRKLWLVAASASAAGAMGILFLYRRLRRNNQRLKESNLQLYASSNRDALTGLFNRRYVEAYVLTLPSGDAGSKSSAAGGGLVLLMDLDRFKELNDTYGHAVGDEVLKSTAERLTMLFRDDDIVVRWGGEEFLAFLPRAHANEAAGIAERVLATVSASPLVVDSVAIPVTISVGICKLRLTLKDRALSWKEVVHLADQALYLAKQDGKNMAYGICEASSVTADEMALGLGTKVTEGQIKLIEVRGK